LAKIVCGGGLNAEEYALYVEKWIAHIIQKPTQKSERPKWLAFISKEQGTGKNLFFDAIGRFFGEYGIKLSSLDRLTAPANYYLVDKLYGQIEEVSRGGSFSSKQVDADKLKSIISSDETLVKQLYKDPVIRKNYSSFVAFTNHISGLPLGPSDRRWAVFECAGKETPKYYTRLAAALNNRDVMQEYFDYLCALDLNGWNCVKDAPKTTIRSKLIRMNAPTYARMLYRLVEQDEDLWKKVKKYTMKTLQTVETPDKLVISPNHLFEIFKQEYKITYALDKFKESLAHDLQIEERKGAKRVDLPNGSGGYSKQSCYYYSMEEIESRLKRFMEGENVEIKDEKHEIVEEKSEEDKKTI
jgi:hypothetical protein